MEGGKDGEREAPRSIRYPTCDCKSHLGSGLSIPVPPSDTARIRGEPLIQVLLKFLTHKIVN